MDSYPAGVGASRTISRETMDITLVICTFNRCESLSGTLDSVALQRLPESVSWEALVVDNNSTDRTREVVESYCHRYPGIFRYVFEPQQGLSRARNAGVREAHGRILAFTDDDVIAEPTWLQNLTTSLHGGEWAGAGGRVLPPQDLDLPGWLTVGGSMDLLGVLLPLFDLGDQPGEMKRPPYGANMAFLKSMFEKHGTFRVDLGHCGAGLLSGEDIEFGDRLKSAGERLHYEPSAVVHHLVPAERLSKKYFRSWWFDYGRTRIIQRSPGPPFLGVPRRFLSLASLALRFLPGRVLRWVFASSTQRRFYNECQIWQTAGEIAQTCRQSR
jgi:glucosyl-dolichyl phosphate glucuronosyltransferase